MPTPECQRRLTKDYKMFLQNPPPFIWAHPDPQNLLVWHYTVDGPPNTAYEGGLYHGKLVFPDDYPFQPPAVYMVTPNGRFKTGGKICLSMSDFHPKEWNPLWSVSSILTGLLSFMCEEQDTYGSIRCTPEQRRRYARDSHSFNLADKLWVELFPEQAALARERMAAQQQKDEAEGVTPADSSRGPERGRPARGRDLPSLVRSCALCAVCAGVIYALYSI
eukprot:TRINITY_DN17374_c1_g1_i1.p1 TRINITY_DN17374_c1_g1~~TRINITY_DN17374_c1_g1_i1.p1  ORF type:complete len:248 (+),score=78.94 TRINITY_DN17374_c1_g1_i1:87-746(+)